MAAPADDVPERAGSPPMAAPGEVQALTEALDDEYRAWATYDQVLRDFGPVDPFRNIVRSEARHIAALQALMRRLGVPVPENPWPGKVTRFRTLADACAASVAAEVENHALHERLLGGVEREDVRRVLRRLATASRERHLPAFERCAARLGRG